MMGDAKTIQEIRRSVDTVPWGQLAHAYHGAWDAPGRLAAFIDPDASERALDEAVEWMWVSILHQGSVYSASPTVLWILLDLLAARPGHPAAPAILYAVETIANALIDYSGEEGAPHEPVQRNRPGEPAYETWAREALPGSSDESVSNQAYFEACFVTARMLRDLVRHAISVIRWFLEHGEDEACTAAVAAGLGALLVVPDDAKCLLDRIEVIGEPDYDPGTWVSVAMVFGRLGRDLSLLLGHTDRRVRLAAAMSSATRGDARSVAELAAALADPEWLEKKFRTARPTWTCISAFTCSPRCLSGLSRTKQSLR